ACSTTSRDTIPSATRPSLGNSVSASNRGKDLRAPSLRVFAKGLEALPYAVRPGISGNVISETTAFLLKPDSNEPTPLCAFRGVFRARTWGTYWRTRLALSASAHRN